jgi:AraC family transcriptional regulator, positive regulator of tynA and feaB
MVEVYQQRLASGDAAAWPVLITRLFGRAEVTIGDATDFRGSITHARLGSLELVDVVSSREVSQRTARHIGHDSRDSFILVNVLRGSVRLRQATHDIEMPAGSFTLYASGRPMLWLHDEHTEIRNVAIPAAMLRGRLRNVERVLCRPHSDRVALWRLTSDYLMSLAGQLRRLPEHAAHGVAGQLFELVMLALEADEGDAPPLGAASVRAALRRACDAYIRGHLADASLGPETIAAAVGISVRSLHRVFREADQTVGDFIRAARLAASHAMLADPGKAHLSIAEIACRAGFRSQAHFANAFKQRYGLAAGEWRRRAIGSLSIS